MIDAVYIFTKGGLILWSIELFPIAEGLVDMFIKDYLLEHRSAENKCSVQSYELRWLPVNRVGVYILVVYKGILDAVYVDTLLSQLKSKVTQKIDPEGALAPLALNDEFRKILDKCDRAVSTRRQSSPPAVASDRPSVGGKGPKGKESPVLAQKNKAGRAWGISDKANPKMMDELDFSRSKSGSSPEQPRRNVYEATDSDVSDESDVEIDHNTKSGLFGKLVSSIQNVTGNAQLGKAELAPVLAAFEEGLMSKNVARDVAAKIVEAVGNQLIGTKTVRFTSVASTVKDAITKSIEDILTPKKSIDILKAALDAKAEGRVYSIAFLGVNGVGKSTNLAKVAYHLKNKGGLKILLAACDTFRAGAVEQLRVHAGNLDIEIFERGYGKDSAEIAKQALAHASANGFDVCLIDTAGRMQDNEPLMRAIAKLVAVNAPDLVLFVGEALVGHDAVDQLTKFNRALIDYSPNPQNVRTVDGIILTKYDTVDDKVGAALSMVFVTGQPIVFVGTGQKYPHLRRLSASEVVKALVS